MTGILLQGALLSLVVYPFAMCGLAAAMGPRRARLVELGRELKVSPFVAPLLKMAVRYLLDAAFDAGLPARLAARVPVIAAHNLSARSGTLPLRISGPAYGLCAEFVRACLWSAFAANPPLTALLVLEIALYAIISRAWSPRSPSPAAVFITAALPAQGVSTR